jgi:hypothetical protein
MLKHAPIEVQRTASPSEWAFQEHEHAKQSQREPSVQPLRTAH